MNSKIKSKYTKLITITLILSILIQIVMPIVAPLKSFGENLQNYEVQAKIGKIIVSSTSTTLNENDEISVNVELEGTNLVSILGWMKYDKEIFEILDITPKSQEPKWRDNGSKDDGSRGHYIAVQEINQTRKWNRK